MRTFDDQRATELRQYFDQDKVAFKIDRGIETFFSYFKRESLVAMVE